MGSAAKARTLKQPGGHPAPFTPHLGFCSMIRVQVAETRREGIPTMMPCMAKLGWRSRITKALSVWVWSPWLLLPDLHIDFSRGRSGGLVFPCLSEFSTVSCDPHSQRLCIANTAEIDVFLKLSCFFNDPADVGNLISVSSAFSFYLFIYLFLILFYF